MYKILKTVSSGKYDRALVKNHPNSNKHDYVLKHRVVMENHIGRLLNDDEIVHHINGDTKDNRIENLKILSVEERAKEHSNVKYINLKCSYCGKSFKHRYNQVVTKIKNAQKDFYCNRSCSGKDFGGGRKKN